MPSQQSPCQAEGPRICWGRRSKQHRALLILLSAGCLALATCGKKQPPEAGGQAPKRSAQEPATSLLPNEHGATTGPGPGTLVLPAGFGKRTGDLDEMTRERSIRAMVI